MMTPLTPVDRFNDPGYINRVKLDMALQYVAEGLSPFCKDVIDNFRNEMMTSLKSTTCAAGCKIKRRRIRTDATSGWYIDCNICHKWLDCVFQQIDKHEFSWKNSKVSEWSTNSWQLAKIFMANGQDSSNVDHAKTDALALLQLMTNCKKFKTRVDDLETAITVTL